MCESGKPAVWKRQNVGVWLIALSLLRFPLCLLAVVSPDLVYWFSAEEDCRFLHQHPIHLHAVSKVYKS